MKQFSVLIFLLFSIELFAQQQKGFSVTHTDSTQSHGTTYALVVGISDYKFVQPLQFATEDAFLYYQFLRSKCGGNVPEENIRLLVDEDATAANIYPRSLSWLKAKNLQSGDRLVIYFSGHGDAVDANEAYLLACDANPAGDKNNYAVTGTVDISKLKNRIQEFSAKGVQVQLIIDACRTDDIPGGRQGITDYNSVIERKAGELLFLGCSANQVSFEDKRWGNGHGAFTWYLVNGLSGLADQDQDGKVSADELQVYVSQNVKRDTRALGNIQTPFFCCNEYASQDISVVDPVLKTQIQRNQQEGTDQFSQQLLAARTANSVVEFPDSALRIQFFAIRKLCREKKFLGSNSADSIYNLLSKIYSEKEIRPVKDYYVSALLDEAQIAVNQTITQPDNKSLPRNFYKNHVDIMQRAMDLIGDESPDYKQKLYPRLLYLQAQEKLSHIGRAFFNISTGEVSLTANDSLYHDMTPYKKVISQLKESIKLGYDYPNAYATIAGIYAKLWMTNESNEDDIRRYSKLAIEKAPKWLLPYRYLTRVTDFDEMERIYINLISSDSNNLDFLNAIAGFYFYETYPNDYSKASYYFEKSFSTDPSQPDVFEALLRIIKYPQPSINKDDELQNRTCDSVIQLTKRYYAHKAPETKSSLSDFAECFLKQKKYEELRTICYDELMTGDSIDAFPYLYVLENDIFKNKNKADSIFNSGFLYQERIDPLDDKRGGIAFGSVEIPKSSSVPIPPDGTQFYEDIGEVYTQMGNEKMHEELLVAALKDFPYSIEAMNRIVNYYTSGYYWTSFYTSHSRMMGENKKSFDKALPYLKKLAEIDSNDYYASLKLADAYLQLGDTIHALLSIPEVKDSSMVNQMYFVSLSKIYIRSGKIDNCLDALIKVFSYRSSGYYFPEFISDSIYSPLDTHIRYQELIRSLLSDSSVSKGAVYYELKEYSKAIEEYKKEMKGEEKDAWYYNIACCYSLLNDTAKTIEYLEAAFKNGFTSYGHDKIQEDHDLDSVRFTPEYEALMKKYFPDQSNAK